MGKGKLNTMYVRLMGKKDIEKNKCITNGLQCIYLKGAEVDTIDDDSKHVTYTCISEEMTCCSCNRCMVVK